MDRVYEYTIYIVVKGLVTESVIRTPLHTTRDERYTSIRKIPQY